MVGARQPLLGVVPGSRRVVSPLALGVNSLTWCQTNTGIASLPSSPRTVVSGSFVFACVAMGALANVVPPTDNRGNTYVSLAPSHNYINWSGAGAHVYAASNVVGDAALVVSEAMSDINDEVTISVVEVRGGTAITNISVADVPGGAGGPTISPTLMISGAALLLSWWLGDGAVVQDDVQPSAGWTLLHALNYADAATGVVQPALAARLVNPGGSTPYSCTWTATGTHGGGGQGGFAFIASVE